MELIFFLGGGLILASGSTVLLYSLLGRLWALQLFFVFYIFISGATFRLREMGDMSVDWHVALKLCVWGAGLLVGLFNYRSTLRLLQQKVGKWFGAWILVAVVSVVYSPNFFLSAGGAIFLIGTVMLSATVVERTSLEKFAKILAATFVLGLVVGILFYFIKPSIGKHGAGVIRLSGVYGANLTGATAGMLTGICTSLWYKKRIRFYSFFLGASLGFFCLIASVSRGAIGAFVISGIGTVILARRKFGTAFTVSLVAAMSGVILWELLGLNLDSVVAIISRSGSAEEIYNLTGRLTLWVISIKLIVQAPIIGYGFGGARAVLVEGLKGSTWSTTHAHNFLLQNTIMLGVVGLLLLLGILYYQIKGVVDYHLPSIDFVTIYILVYGMTTSIISKQPTVMLTIWFSTVLWRSKTQKHI
jgi:O-antigen ligase